MATLNEITYSILEKLKILSDDEFPTTSQIEYLIDSKREYLLNQKFSDYRRIIPEIIKQTIEFEMLPEERILGLSGDNIIVSKEVLPALLYMERINSALITGRDFKESYLNFVSYERFLYAGKDRWLNRQVYAAFRDGRLYLKSGTYNETSIKILNMTGVFSRPKKAYEMSPRYDPSILFENIEYPLNETLVDTIENMIVDDFLKTKQIKEDVRNNAAPD